MRRRQVDGTSGPMPAGSSRANGSPRRSMVKKLDFMFPKVEQEYTFQTDSGGVVSVVAMVFIVLLVAAETWSWVAKNGSTLEHVSVDTSLGKKMRVNMNITFPALACEDLHVDVMDVAGDAQMDVRDTLVKQSLDLDGTLLSAERMALNKHHKELKKKESILNTDLPEGYCGPCYGAESEEGQCCNTCDDLLEAYKTKNWSSNVIQAFSEQCIREGRDHVEPKLMTKDEGCRVFGYIEVNRVAGNFHIAMGEGVERGGRHIHKFDPDDTPNFNASHIIHHLSFGPSVDSKVKGVDSLDGVTKIVTKEYGTTGLFQYFIKIVPTTYIGEGTKASGRVETNRYFFTERFRPLMKEYIEDDHFEEDEERAAVTAGGGKKHDHHNVRNAVLPGVFFMYEIDPFEVVVSRVNVPLTHLVIRLMATIGGVYTVFRLLDGLFES